MIGSTPAIDFTAREIRVDVRIAPDSPSTAEMYQAFIQQFIQHGFNVAIIPISYGTNAPGHVHFRVSIMPVTARELATQVLIEEKKEQIVKEEVKEEIVKDKAIKQEIKEEIREAVKPLTPAEILKNKLDAQKQPQPLPKTPAVPATPPVVLGKAAPPVQVVKGPPKKK